MPAIIENNNYIEIFGHYDDKALCAKLTLLANLFAVEHRNGYAKFKIEDANKLELINGELEFLADPVSFWIDIDRISSVVGRTMTVTSGGVTIDGVSKRTASPPYGETFLGLSTIDDATTPDTGFAVGDSHVLAIDDHDTWFNPVYGTPAPSLNDLTNTTWTWKNTFDTNIILAEEFAINFISNSVVFNLIYIEAQYSIAFPDFNEYFSTDVIYNNYDSGDYINAVVSGDETSPSGQASFPDSSYRTFTITGGSDVTNSDLIAFLEANATQVVSHTLTFDNTVTVKVNGTTVSSGYVLQDNDVISVITSSNIGSIYVNNTPHSVGSTIDIYNSSIDVSYVSGGGGATD